VPSLIPVCYRLAHVISSAWETLIVMGQEAELAQARLLLYMCARDVLANAMRLLSLTPITRM
jgi:arginyl-tRNA synthetase